MPMQKVKGGRLVHPLEAKHIEAPIATPLEQRHLEKIEADGKLSDADSKRLAAARAAQDDQ